MRIVTRAALAIVLAAVAFYAYAWRQALPPVEPRPPSSFDPSIVRAGEALAALGNCISCHTREGGPHYAGGRAVDTPFGRIYATNITPDLDTGIGRWSEAAFVRAMREGVARDGRHLYPAFPYDHMTRVAEFDIKAVYAFLMTRTPVKATTPRNDLRFPYNVRPLLAGWKLLFLERGELDPDASKSAAWNRGAYLAEGLAHCGACHTPRNTFGAEMKGRAYAGGQNGGWSAPALNAASPAAVPWTEERLYDYLRNGQSATHGVAAGPMADVVRNLGGVPDADLKAMATYIASVAGEASKERREQAEKVLARARGLAAPRQAGPATGASIYAGACAQCHGEAGRKPVNPALNLSLSTSVQASDPNNLIRIVLGGIAPIDNGPGPIMPGFSAVLTDNQVADLVDYLRASFTDRTAFSAVETAVRKAR